MGEIDGEKIEKIKNNSCWEAQILTEAVRLAFPEQCS